MRALVVRMSALSMSSPTSAANFVQGLFIYPKVIANIYIYIYIE